MSRDDVMQIRVDSISVGIVGLKEIVEDMAREYAERTDDEVRGELFERLSKRNYLPEKQKDSYSKAFLREFKRFLKKPYEEEAFQGLEVKILGAGCYQCNKLEQDLMAAMAQLDLRGAVEHVRDIKEIGKYGIMGTPALIINGKVRCVGKVPLKSKLVEWLMKA
jgi:hypothetical protein